MYRSYARTIAVLGSVLREPKLLSEVWSKLQSRLTDKCHRTRISTYAEQATSITEAFSQLLNLEPNIVQSRVEAKPLRCLLKQLQVYQVPPQGSDMGGAAFLEACYSVVSLTKPKIVLETGVAHGYSTSVILQALEDNKEGMLYSVDLPSFRPGAKSLTGGAVPEHLRFSNRWELVLGPDRHVLPSLLKRIGPIDVFHYDSDKSYEGMMRTWGLVWPHLSPGAVLLLDDVHLHDAFLDFADTQGLTPIVISKPTNQGVYRWGKTYFVGLLRKHAR